MRKFLLTSAILMGLSLFGLPVSAEPMEENDFSKLRKEQFSEKIPSNKGGPGTDFGSCPQIDKNTIITLTRDSDPIGLFMGTYGRCFGVLVKKALYDDQNNLTGIDVVIVQGPYKDQDSSIRSGIARGGPKTFRVRFNYGVRQVAVDFTIEITSAFSAKLRWNSRLGSGWVHLNRVADQFDLVYQASK